MTVLRRSVVRAREAAEAIDRDLKAIAARAREADARRAELEKQYKLQVRLMCALKCAALHDKCMCTALIVAGKLSLHVLNMLLWSCFKLCLGRCPQPVQGQNGLAALGRVHTSLDAVQGERASQAEATAEEKMKSYEQKKTVAEQADAYKKVIVPL